MIFSTSLPGPDRLLRVPGARHEQRVRRRRRAVAAAARQGRRYLLPRESVTAITVFNELFQ